MSRDGQVTWTGHTCGGGGGAIMHPLASKAKRKKRTPECDIPCFVSRESQLADMGRAGLHT